MIQKKFLTVLITSLLIIGCNEKSTDNKTESTITATESSIQSDTDQSEQLDSKAKKANLWLDVLELKLIQPGITLGKSIQSTSMVDAVETYIEKYSDKNGQIILKNIRKSKGQLDPFFLISYGNVKLEFIQNYQELIDKLIAFPPKLTELDSTGKTYSEQFVALGMAYIDLYTYYKVEKEYMLDDFAKSTQLHNNLLTAYKNYSQAKDNAFVTYNNLYKELHNAQKMQIKKQGLVISYNIFESLDLSESIVNLIIDNSKDEKALKKFDKTILEKKIIQLETIINEFKSNRQNKEAITKEGLKMDAYNQYVDSLSSFIVQAKVILRDIQEKNIKTKIVNLNNIEFDKVIKNYNNVIN